ncbi:hypothetical protein KM043_012448 [Ampulex compressa]|nr:hypothetical protein KM043_012448 [Ampulex compressa]
MRQVKTSASGPDTARYSGYELHYENLLFIQRLDLLLTDQWSVSVNHRGRFTDRVIAVDAKRGPVSMAFVKRIPACPGFRNTLRRVSSSKRNVALGNYAFPFPSALLPRPILFPLIIAIRENGKAGSDDVE